MQVYTIVFSITVIGRTMVNTHAVVVTDALSFDLSVNDQSICR